MTTHRRTRTRGGIGASVLRHEDPPLLTGSARYIADVRLPGQLAMVVVRSPVAHGTLRAVDTSGAVALPGVEAAFTAKDLVDSLGCMPHIPPRVSFDETVLPYLQPLLAVDRVRYTGEPLAVVLAEDRYLAEDAAELVFADIDQHPAVVDAGPQAEQGAQLFEIGNLVTTLHAGFGDAERAFRNAEQVIEVELSVGRHSGVPMETRGLAVEFDPGTGRLTVIRSHQGTPLEPTHHRGVAGHAPEPDKDARDRHRGRFRRSGRAVPRGCAGGVGSGSPPAVGLLDRGPSGAPACSQPFAPATAPGEDRGRPGRPDRCHHLGLRHGRGGLHPDPQHPRGGLDAVDDPRTL